MNGDNVAAREAAFAEWFGYSWGLLPHDICAGFWREGWADYASPPARWRGTYRSTYLAGRRAARAYARTKEPRP